MAYPARPAPHLSARPAGKRSSHAAGAGEYPGDFGGACVACCLFQWRGPRLTIRAPACVLAAKGCDLGPIVAAMRDWGRSTTTVSERRMSDDASANERAA